MVYPFIIKYPYFKWKNCLYRSKSDREILYYSPSKIYSSILIVDSALETNKTYKLLLDQEKYTPFTVSQVFTTIGNSSGMNPGFGRR